MAGRRHGVIYIGSAIDLAKRAWEHRNGVADGYTKQYGCHRLVWCERMTIWPPPECVSGR